MLIIGCKETGDIQVILLKNSFLNLHKEALEDDFREAKWLSKDANMRIVDDL